MMLSNPYAALDDQSSDESTNSDTSDDNVENERRGKVKFKKEKKYGPQLVELDIDLTAQANARKYYDKKDPLQQKRTKLFNLNQGLSNQQKGGLSRICVTQMQ